MLLLLIQTHHLNLRGHQKTYIAINSKLLQALKKKF